MPCEPFRHIAAAALVGLGSVACAEAQEPAAVPEEYVALAKDVLMTSIGYRTVEGAGQMRPYADYLAGVLTAGGFAPEDVRITDIDGTSMLVATLHGESAEGPILLSGHMDVVEAKREDWERDPFVAVEENGYIYGRGSLDMKHGIVEMVVTLVRLKQEGFTPARDIVLVLSGDEETAMETTQALAEEFQGASLLLNADAGGGLLSEDGEPAAYYVQAAEKTYADFRVEVVNAGGHSSQPRADNAIYQLAQALTRIEAYRFPVETSEITTGFFRETGASLGGEKGAVMLAFAENPEDEAAIAALRAEPDLVGQLGTTCVATMLEGGHANNALPQRAAAVVNCRIFPGVDPDDVRDALVAAIDDPGVTIDYVDDVDASDASPLREDVMAAVRKALDRRYPGLPVIPQMSAGATDSLHFRGRGVPSYGVSGIFIKASDEFAHGLNERVPVDNIAPSLDHWHVLLTELGK
jgi:acetylornithine deacetylase/succinyl-diaminopimelate desuccinylase-like protein